jgi:hypothetical protein
MKAISISSLNHPLWTERLAFFARTIFLGAVPLALSAAVPGISSVSPTTSLSTLAWATFSASFRFSAALQPPSTLRGRER